MAEIDTTIKHTPPDKDKREFRATACSLCVWVVILAFCWVFSTTEVPLEDMSIGELTVRLLMLLISLFMIFVAIYKIGRGLLNLYKQR